MDFKIGHCSGKDIPLEARYYTPEEMPPPKNMLVLCYSKYGCSRKDIFNPRFDSHWSPLLPKPVKK